MATLTLRVVRQRIYHDEYSYPAEKESTKTVSLYMKYTAEEHAYSVEWEAGKKRLGVLCLGGNGIWYLKTYGRRPVKYLVLAVNGEEKDLTAMVDSVFETKGENQ